MTTNTADGGALDAGQVRQLEALAATLSSEQALWVSGYLAGLARHSPTANGQKPAADGAAGRTAARPANPDRVTVLYGTETGNSERVARRLAERGGEHGLNVRALDMAEYQTRDLRQETHLLVVTATHGEGDPPEPAKGFVEFLQGRKAPDLAGVKFAVLALGDSSYVHFCGAARLLDRRLEELGGHRLTGRVECDVDFDDDADRWTDDVIGLLRRQLTEETGTATAPEAAPVASAGNVASVLTVGDTVPRYTRRNPYRAEILENILLSGRDSRKETRHLELAIEAGELAFRPGDSLAVVAENEDSIVEAVVEALDLRAGEPVTVNGQAKVLADALKADLELTRLTPSFLRSWADAAGAVELAGLVSDGAADTLRRFMACNQVLDVIEHYPVRRLAAQEFVGMLRGLQPRLYSIASSPTWLPGQIDLTVAVTRTTADGKLRNGVASTFLAERRKPGQALDVYVQPHRTFRLPADLASPVIMIGAGAGVAPFRAFLQDREETGATGRTWLFFGERTFREDFLYQTEWQRFLRTGVLTRMDVAFSRDQERKVYVQHRVRERVLDVWTWLEEGAHVYVCGDAAGMAPAVNEALVAVAREGGSLSRDSAEAYVEALRAQGRYERDVY